MHLRAQHARQPCLLSTKDEILADTSTAQYGTAWLARMLGVNHMGHPWPPRPVQSGQAVAYTHTSSPSLIIRVTMAMHSASVMHLERGLSRDPIDIISRLIHAAPG